ncbi:MAG: AAA family ATPase, partial [Deltaproteobacteria bacterium]|nr:AAA family ATPase [Deltaproteobacteria bacterium]
LTKAIIKKLALAAANPNLKGRPIVIYFDGTPGIGKTEIAKAVAEALFDDQSRLTRIDFNEIVDLGTLYRFGIEKMNAAIKTNPESQVILWDELHRITHTPSKQLIENTLMNVIDEGKLPKSPDSQEKIEMPGATVIIATGNMLELALKPGARSMTNRELMAEFRLIMRHPEQFLAVFEKSFGGAFRSRLGAPLLFSPLTDDEVDVLRDRLFEENTKIIRANGVKKVELSKSAKEFFTKEYVPLEGGRWIRRAMEMYVENALVAEIVGSEGKYEGVSIEIVWDEKARQLKGEVSRDGKVVETLKLADVPRTKSDYHPDVKEKTAWKTSAHEAMGHALVRTVLYGADAVAEINTFGGGEGGWMEPNTSAAGEEMYQGTKSGIKLIAVMLAGHIAELKALGVSANGASSDFERARSVAQTMLLDGSMPDIAPIAVIKNPSTGQIDMSEAKKQELEKKVTFLLEYSAKIAEMIIDKNRELGDTVAKALHDAPDMHMTGDDFRKLVEGKMQPLGDHEMESARQYAVQATEFKSTLSCATLLTKAEAVPAKGTSKFKAFWQWLTRWFR